MVAWMLLVGASVTWGQQYERYGNLSIRGHGFTVPSAYIQYLRQEGQRLVVTHRALGMPVPNDFYFQIDFLANADAYYRYLKSKGHNGEGSLGVTLVPQYREKTTGRISGKIMHPVPVIVFYNTKEPFKTIPTLIHEMCHAIPPAGYGALPLWFVEGVADWFSVRPQHVAVDKKISELLAYRRLLEQVEEMSDKDFVKLIAAAEYSDWQELLGSTGRGYRMSQALVDLFMHDIKVAQPVFRKALAEARAKTKYQNERSLEFAKSLQRNWPGGIAKMVGDWKRHYRGLATPKRSDQYAVAVRANRHRMMAVAQAKGVTPYTYVTQWLITQRVELEDLRKKGLHSLQKDEVREIRRRTQALSKFADFDHKQRWPAIEARRKAMRKNFGPDRKDRGYVKAIPYADLRRYLGIHPDGHQYALPRLDPRTGLASGAFRWPLLDQNSAVMIYRNLANGYRKPVRAAFSMEGLTPANPLEEALNLYRGKPLEALKSIGAKVELDTMGEVVSVDLSGARVTDNTLGLVMAQVYPERLDLTGTDISDDALEDLMGWAQLKQIKLGGTRVTKRKVELLQFLSPHLEVLK